MIYKPNHSMIFEKSQKSWKSQVTEERETLYISKKGGKEHLGNY